MKKTYTLILLLLFFILRSFAYNGGPDTWGIQMEGQQ
jgi:hypothetical protein